MDISNYMTYCWGLLSGNTGYKLVESKQDKLKITCAIFELNFFKRILKKYEPQRLCTYCFRK